MISLPYRKFVWVSALTQEQALDRLISCIDPSSSKPYHEDSTHTTSRYTFRGIIKGQSFTIRRITNYKSSFMPEIVGAIEPWETGSHITVRMCINAIEALVSAAILVFVLYMFTPWDYDYIAIFPIAVIGFSLVLSIIAPFYEAAKARKLLREIFEVS